MRNVVLKFCTAMIDKKLLPQLVSKRLYNARFYKISTKLLLMFCEKTGVGLTQFSSVSFVCVTIGALHKASSFTSFLGVWYHMKRK